MSQLRDIAEAGDPSKFITLTVRTTEFDDADEAAQALVHAWRMVVQRAKRDFGFKKLPYLAVFEETKQGWPHLHILARSPYIDQGWLSERMAQYLNSPNVWITAVRNGRHAANYVAKYISKGPGRFAGTKRYWKTQDYQLRPTSWDRDKPITDSDCLYHRRMPEELAEIYSRRGYDVHWSSWNRFTASRDPEYVPPIMWDAYVARGRGPPSWLH